jgi:LysM repeat protein
MDPPSRLATDKQERLCLTSAHLDCPLFEAAAGLSALTAADDDLDTAPAHRPMPRTTPVILDRAGPQLPPILPDLRMPAVSDRLAALRLGRAQQTAQPRPSPSSQPDDDDLAALVAPNAGDEAMAIAAGASAASPRPRSASPTVADPADAPSGVTQLSSSIGATMTAGLASLRRAVDNLRSPATPATSNEVASQHDPESDLTPVSPPRTTPAYRSLGSSGGTGPSTVAGRLGSSFAGRELQAALVGVMVLALVAVLLVRFNGSGSTAAVAGASSSPRPSGAAATARPSASPRASAALVAGASAEPTADASAAATEEPTSPAATARPKPTPTPKAATAPTTAATRTYKVKSGDTLSGIAAKYNVKLAALMRLNNITDVRSLRVGQLLKIPS